MIVMGIKYGIYFLSEEMPEAPGQSNNSTHNRIKLSRKANRAMQFLNLEYEL